MLIHKEKYDLKVKHQGHSMVILQRSIHNDHACHKHSTINNSDQNGSIPMNAWVPCKTARCDYQESVTTGQTHRPGQNDPNILYTALNSPSLIFDQRRSETGSPSLEFAHTPVFFHNPLSDMILQSDEKSWNYGYASKEGGSGGLGGPQKLWDKWCKILHSRHFQALKITYWKHDFLYQIIIL